MFNVIGNNLNNNMNTGTTNTISIAGHWTKRLTIGRDPKLTVVELAHPNPYHNPNPKLTAVELAHPNPNPKLARVELAHPSPITSSKLTLALLLVQHMPLPPTDARTADAATTHTADAAATHRC